MRGREPVKSTASTKTLAAWKARVTASRATAWADPLLVALFAIVVSGMLSWRPSFWHDEAATVSAATRDIPSLVSLLFKVDAVHGLYYVAMHEWLRVVPTDEIWVRAPSVVAVGVAAAGVVVLGKLVATREIALVSGLLCAMLPRITSAGIEARQYAASAAVAVWLTVVFVIAARRRHTIPWVLYALGVALSTSLFLYSGLIAVAHGVTLLLARQWRRLPAFVVAVLAGCVLAAPIAELARSQSSQIDWISDMQFPKWRVVLLEQYFDESVAAAVVAGVVLIAGVALAVRRRTTPGRPQASPGLLQTAAPWVIVPSAIVLVYALTVQDVYLARYFTFTAPGFALLLGWCAVSIARAAGRRRTLALALILVAFAATCVPGYLDQRGPYAKPSGMDYSQVGALVADHAQAGDCVLFDLNNSWNPAPMRAVKVVEPRDFDDLRDISLGVPGAAIPDLWDQTLAPELVVDRMNTCGVIWFVTDGTDAPYGTDSPGQESTSDDEYRVLTSLGFRPDDSWQVNVSEVVRLTR